MFAITKESLCDNMIDNGLKGTEDEVIMATTIMHKITKMSIVYTMMMLSNC